MLHELSFGRTNFIGASKGALELGFERLVASEDCFGLILLELLFIG